MGDRAHQRHGLAQSQAARLTLQRRPARAVADHQQMGLGDPRVQRLERLGAQVYRTDLDGTVTVETDGKTLDVHRQHPRPAVSAR